MFALMFVNVTPRLNAITQIPSRAFLTIKDHLAGRAPGLQDRDARRRLHSFFVKNRCGTMSLSDVMHVMADRLGPEEYRRLLFASLGGAGSAAKTRGSGKIIANAALQELNAWANPAATSLANKIELGFLAAEVIVAAPTPNEPAALEASLRALEDALNHGGGALNGGGGWTVRHPTRAMTPWHPIAEFKHPEDGVLLRCERMWIPGSSRGSIIIETQGPNMAGVTLNAIGNRAGGWNMVCMADAAARILIRRVSEMLREIDPTITITCL